MLGVCGGCRYWIPFVLGERGHCRRYPPSIVMDIDHGAVARTPDTRRLGWCGEWQPIEPEVKADAV